MNSEKKRGYDIVDFFYNNLKGFNKFWNSLPDAVKDEFLVNVGGFVNSDFKKYIDWNEDYSDLVDWETFDSEWIFCNGCGLYDDTPCICYTNK